VTILLLISASAAGATKLCFVTSNLSGVKESEFQVKNKWRGKKYYLATPTVRVIIGPADLRFELWFKGEKFSRNHNPITVQWERPGALLASSHIHERDEWEATL
jgi:hypothetical protein